MNIEDLILKVSDTIITNNWKVLTEIVETSNDLPI